MALQNCRAMRWDDLTYLLAVMRGGSLSRAARALAVDKTTVARRLAALEEALGAALLERARDGRLSLTEAGRRAATRAEAMEDAARALRADLGEPGALPDPVVRLTAVPLVVNHLLLPALGRLDGVTLELISEPRDLDLAARDADIALRLARPRGGGQAVLARRLGQLGYGCFEKPGAGAQPWIGYGAGMQHLDHARAIEALAARSDAGRAAVSVNDAETLLQAVLAGQGRSLLPRRVAAAHPGLREVALPGERLPEREVWLMLRRDISDLDRVRRVTRWLTAIFA